jgi:hypothetical protein
MSKNILVAVFLVLSSFCFAQDNNEGYFKKPFAIYRSTEQLILAGEVSTHVYSNYFGKDVEKEIGNNSHQKPEYLVYDLFRNIKIRNLDNIDKLYDTSFNRSDFNLYKIESSLRNVTDIKFRSKFVTGDRIVIRYDFISGENQIPYFAAIRNIGGEYYLTMDLNLSDPFNVIGSFSPYNLFDKTNVAVNTDHMTAFYFVEKDNKIFFTNEKPGEDYTALYLSITHYHANSKAPELDLLKKIETASLLDDSSTVSKLVIPSEKALLSDPSFVEYLHFYLMKMFKNYSEISPLGSIETNDGKIVYLKFSNPRQSANVATILFRKWGNQWYISMKRTAGEMNNLLQNAYVREAITDYFKKLF